MKALSEPVKITEAVIHPAMIAAKAMGATRMKRTLGVLIAGAGLLLVLTQSSAHAQNAAQLAALSRLGRSQAVANLSAGLPNGVEATSAPLARPSGAAFDTAGNLYIADTDDNVIREVSLTGAISTVAGTGVQGYGGDSGTATSALLDSPDGVAVDSNGNIYIADTHNNRIREVSGGTINTIAGTGVAGYSGDGAAATAAMLDFPTAVAVAANGNIYIADTNNNRIREISGTTIATVAGNGQQTYSGDGGLATAAGLNSPSGVAVDSAFNIYIGDTDNQRVRLVTFATGIISTLAGTGTKGFNSDGPAGSAELASPRGLAVNGSGTVYLADSDNNRIRTVIGGNVTTIAGSGAEGFSGDTDASTSASLDKPRSVAVAASTVVIADTENNRIRVVNSGTLDTVVGIPPLGSESIVLGSALNAVYGTGTLTATFSHGSTAGTGLVTFYDGEGASPAVVGSATLSANSAILDTSHLSAVTHYLVASYAGDAKNPAVASGVYVFVVTPVQLTATANTVNLLYGQPIPALTGALTGVLTQDAGNVTAAFATAATTTSAPGNYPITVSLTGSAAGNYTVVLGAGSGSVVIAQAQATTTLTSGSATPVLGTPLTLTATVVSTTSGAPTGTVNFFNGPTLLNSTPVALSSGVANFMISTLPVGAQSITAVYSGDTDFTSSTSSPVAENVLSPDFTVTASPAAQSVLPLHSVGYNITLTPMNPTFVYPVSLSASGLPPGVTASFMPSSIATGVGRYTSILTLSAGSMAQSPRNGSPFASGLSSTALALLLLPLAFIKRARKIAAGLSRSGRMLIALLALAAAGAISGCGGGGLFNHSTKSYTVTVTAVSGPDTHTTDVTLTVQ